MQFEISEEVFLFSIPLYGGGSFEVNGLRKKRNALFAGQKSAEIKSVQK
jgi:hypothetical protein